MILEQIITYALTAFVTTISIAYLNKYSEQEVVRNERGLTVLRMNKLYKILALALIGIALLFLFVATYLQEEAMYIVAFLMLLFFGGFGFVLLFYYKNHKVEFDDNFIKINNWKGEQEELRWDEIATVKSNTLVGNLKLNFKNKSITIDQYLIGINALTRKLEEKKLFISELK